jgi:hypothetical protein
LLVLVVTRCARCPGGRDATRGRSGASFRAQSRLSWLLHRAASAHALAAHAWLYDAIGPAAYGPGALRRPWRQAGKRRNRIPDMTTSASAQLRQMIALCPAIGRATQCSANGKRQFSAIGKLVERTPWVHHARAPLRRRQSRRRPRGAHRQDQDDRDLEASDIPAWVSAPPLERFSR